MRVLICVLLFSGVSAIAVSAEPKGSIYADGQKGLDEIQQVGRGYGVKACSGRVTKKEEIKPRAWPIMEGKCGILTIQNESKFADDPSVMYSICIGAALEACQAIIGVLDPCNDLPSCRASLGVPP